MSDCMTQEDAENMNNKQAINILVPLRDMLLDQNGCPISDAFFALHKAILALSAQPERKKGEWLAKWSGDGEVLLEEICSECGTVIEDDIPTGYNFCPFCGADMRGESE